MKQSRTIGAHLSISDGFEEALSRTAAIGGSALQMFSASPRAWSEARVGEGEAAVFRRKAQELGIFPMYFHASYLVNLADPGRVGERSVASLIAELRVAKLLGVRGSIVHLGSFKDGDEREGKHPNYPILIRNIKKVLAEAPAETLLIIENAGMRKIGRRLEEIGQIIKDVGSARLRVCLDTCHLHAAGSDLSSKPALEAFLKTFDKAVGLDRLEVIHANDSRDPFGSFRDRHENIGEGTIPRVVFQLLLTDPKTKGLPFVLETPGFDGMGPDKKNIDRLRSLAR